MISTDFPHRLVCRLIFVLILSSHAFCPTATGHDGPGIVVTKNGQVLVGVVSELPNGVGVQMATEFRSIPAEQVDVVAESIVAAYEKKRDRLTSRASGTDHMQLSRWCRQWGLLEQADIEQQTAHKLDPSLRPANLNAVIAAESVSIATEPEGPRMVMTANGFVERSERSNLGLLRETHRDFIRRIQPLVLNKCGNAHCHGEVAPNAFHLEPIRPGVAANRLQNHANLVALIRFMNFEQPKASPLLRSLSDTTHATVFTGAKADEQFRTLQMWVIQVASTSKIDTSLLTPTPTIARESTTRFTPYWQQQTGTAAEQIEIVAPEPFRPAEDARPLSVEDHGLVSRDAFDPEQFNRRVHGNAIRTSKMRTESNPSESGVKR